jgi:hypothetical protein
MTTEDKKMAELLVEAFQSQQGTFIGAYNLTHNYEEHKDEMLAEMLQNLRFDFESFWKEFDSHVKGVVVEEVDLLTEEEIKKGEEDELYWMDNPKFGDIEKCYPVSELKDTNVEVPNGFEYFKVLPVDYNRPGFPTEIVLAFLTETGKNEYAQYLTGDY